MGTQFINIVILIIMSSTYRKRILARLREEEKLKESGQNIYVPLKQRKLLEELKSTDFVYESSGSSMATPTQSQDNSDGEEENEAENTGDKIDSSEKINIIDGDSAETTEEAKMQTIDGSKSKIKKPEKTLEEKIKEKRKAEEEEEKKQRAKIQKVFGGGQKMSLFDENLIEQGIVAEENKNKQQTQKEKLKERQEEAEKVLINSLPDARALIAAKE